MSDAPVRTRVLSGDRWWPFQEYMIRSGGGPVQDVDFRGLRAAGPTAEVLEAIATARAIVIGPSNPVISIGPILSLRGVREAMQASPAPVVAVSPIVRDAVLKGPTDEFMRFSGQPLSSAGIAACYAGLLDGLVADGRAAAVPVLETDVLMVSAEDRRRLAEETLDFALGLS
jgi:LPPG:FO 2-phospho-L-lactate transferase